MNFMAATASCVRATVPLNSLWSPAYTHELLKRAYQMALRRLAYSSKCPRVLSPSSCAVSLAVAKSAAWKRMSIAVLTTSCALSALIASLTQHVRSSWRSSVDIWYEAENACGSRCLLIHNVSLQVQLFHSSLPFPKELRERRYTLNMSAETMNSRTGKPL